MALKFQTLDEYFAYVMSQPFLNLAPVYHGVYQYGKLMSIVLHRQDNYQLELFLVPKEIQLLEFHIHPNVDSYELHMSGDFVFESNNIQYNLSESCLRLVEKLPVNVPSTHIHGGIFKTAGSFMSFQQWNNGVQPTSVGEDFEVDHKNPSHLKGLQGVDRLDKPVIID